MAIGIDTLVLIVLAVVVLAVMIYLVLKTSSTRTLDCNACKASFTQYCYKCFSSMCSAYKIKSFNEKLPDCLNQCGFSGITSDSTCKDEEIQHACQAVGITYAC